MTRTLLALTVVFSAFPVHAQSLAQWAANFMDDATITSTGERQITVSASSPRPMQQAVIALRRHYGWVLDYEEGKYGTNHTWRDQYGELQLIGSRFTVSLSKPQSVGLTSELGFLDSFVSQVSAATNEHFELLSSSSQRQTIALEIQGKRPILDTPIRLSKQSRSINATVEAILSQVSRRTGHPIIMAGLIDGELVRSAVAVGADADTPARSLLAAALNKTIFARVWSLSYDPNEGKFYFGVEAAVREETMPNGEIEQLLIRNQE